MKKVLTIVLGVVFLTTTVSGSILYPYRVGVRLGGNLANMTSEIDTDARLGASVTGLVQYAFERHPQNHNVVSLITGLGYSQKGAKRSMGTMKNDYLIVPVQFNYSLDSNLSALLYAFGAGGMFFHVFGGGHLGYLLSAKQGSKDVKSQTESLDFGVTAGIAVTYIISEFNMIRLDVAYELGLANQATSGEDSKNRLFTLGLSYLFH